MAYVRPNFKSKAELKRAITEGQKVSVWQMNDLFNREFRAGEWIAVEMPWFPEAHRAYAQCLLDENLHVVKVK